MSFSRFTWYSGMQQRSEVDHPAAPDGICIIGPTDAGGFTQHYFDSRGIARVYEMSFADGVWELLRVKPDFTPLSFSQRYVGRFSEDGNRIAGQWESSHDRGTNWELDFHLNYWRVA